jgi:hypothetical protein
MKNLTLLSIMMLTVHLWTFAQCDPKGITTNPDMPNNPEHPIKENTFFDWNEPEYDLYQSVNGIGNLRNIPSPFTQIQNPNLSKYHQKEMLTEDGWELIERNLGFKDDGSLRSDLTNPTLVLYNKYSGRLLVFVAIGDKDEDHETAEISLGHHEQSQGFKRAFLGHADNIMEGVKTFNPNIEVSTIHKFYNYDNKWLVAEFQMAYDPCTCMNENKEILIETSLIDSAKIILTGTINGTITPIEVKNKKIASNSVSLKGVSTFFKKVGDNVKKGTTIYDGLSDLFSASREIATTVDSSTNPPTQAIADATLAGLEALAEANDQNKWPTPNASILGANYPNTGNTGSTNSNNGSPSSGGSGLKFLSKTLKAIPFVGDALGVITSFIGGGKASGGPQKVTFGPLATDAKIDMSGYISSSNAFVGLNFNMPGSTNIPANDLYPYYNETMGIMNVLERPKVERLSYEEVDYEFDWDLDDDPTWSREISAVYTQFELTEDILYAVNPAPGFDLSKLDILGAMFFETRNSTGSKGMIKVREHVYRTPFLPLGCLKGYIANFETKSNVLPATFENVYFKIAAGLIRTDEPEAAPVIYSASYKLDITEAQGSSASVKRSNLPDLEGENIRLENRVLQPGEEVFATQSITIGPGVTVAAGGTASLVAGASIIIEDDIELDPNLDLRVDDPTPCKRTVAPATKAQITAICQSEDYLERANKRSETAPETAEIDSKLLSDPKVFPNPSTGSFMVRYALEAPALQVQATVLDITGREVLSPFQASNQAEGQHTFELDLGAFPQGVYSLILT